jgi:hypothetical protein
MKRDFFVYEFLFISYDAVLYFYFMKYALFSFAFICLLFACNQQRQRPDDALGTAREFIRSSLDGDYEWASKLMVQDSVNLFELEQIEKKYKNDLTESEKEAYKKSAIIIHSVEPVSDSVVIVNYSNSFKKKQMPVRVIKKDGLWQVDFNYTFTGNL